MPEGIVDPQSAHMWSHNYRAIRGGFTLHAVIILLTVFSLAGIITVIVRRQQSTQQQHRRVALQNCEDGLMVALARVTESPSWREGIEQTQHRDGWYRVSLELDDSVGTLFMKVRSEGASGDELRLQICTLMLSVVEGDSVWIQQKIEER